MSLDFNNALIRRVKTRMWKFVTGMVYSIRFMGAVRILFVGTKRVVAVVLGGVINTKGMDRFE